MTGESIENINCPFCESENAKLYDQEGRWKIVRCKSCGFIYTNPRPTPESLPGYYEESYFKDKRHYSKFYNSDGTRKTVGERYDNRVADVENYASERGRLLEIGSARGAFLQVMKSRGWEVEGVEISRDAAILANESGIKTHEGVFSDYAAEAPFDVICMYQTLEHVPDPKQVITKAFSGLNPGGLFIVEVPNINCTELKVSKERRHLSYDLPRHLNHFSPAFLAKEMEKAGFEIVEIDHYPPKFLLKLISIGTSLFSKRSSGIDGVIKNGNNKQVLPTYPLKRKNRSIKNRLVQSVSRILPGWRFTITAKKKVGE